MSLIFRAPYERMISIDKKSHFPLITCPRSRNVTNRRTTQMGKSIFFFLFEISLQIKTMRIFYDTKKKGQRTGGLHIVGRDKSLVRGAGERASWSKSEQVSKTPDLPYGAVVDVDIK